jgi:hypothetical protein
VCQSTSCGQCAALTARRDEELRRSLELVGGYAAMAADGRRRVAMCVDLGDLNAQQREVARKLSHGAAAHNAACAAIIFGAVAS